MHNGLSAACHLLKSTSAILVCFYFHIVNKKKKTVYFCN